MQYEVTRDFGVTVAGTNHKHGSVLDTDKIDLPPPAVPTDGTKLEQPAIEAANAASKDAAMKEVEAAVKAGYLIPAKPESARPRNQSKEKEG